MTSSNPYPIGTPGQPWGEPEREQWRARQRRQRSYAQEVLAPVSALADRFDLLRYGQIEYGSEHFPLIAAQTRGWRDDLPCALITGGVHGYETSGVHGALRFLLAEAERYTHRFNLLVAPCVSPWAYERIQRWNFHAVDPNRSFKVGGAAQESAALMRLVEPLRGRWLLHMDLHETTDTDESEFRPALAARDGKPFEPGTIPDGFYVVDDSGNPQSDFQQAIIAAVQRVTHIAPVDDKGELIASPAVARGVIHYDLTGLGLCASITGARYTCTTEVYPDSPRTSPEQCIEAQRVAVCAALDFVAAAS